MLMNTILIEIRILNYINLPIHITNTLLPSVSVVYGQVLLPPHWRELLVVSGDYRPRGSVWDLGQSAQQT